MECYHKINLLQISIVILLWLTSCQPSSQYADFSNYPPEGKDSVAWISNWSIIGPFGYDTLQQTAKEAFFNKDLADYGIEVPDFTFADFSEFKPHQGILRHIVTKDEFLDFIKLSGDSTKGLSNFYAYALIESRQDKETIFIADASSSYKIWLNGEKILQVRGMQSNNRIADRFVPVKLQKGKNHLFAKVCRDNNQYAWKLIAGLADQKKAKEIFKINYFKDFIRKAVTKDSLNIYTGPYKQANAEMVFPDVKKTSLRDVNKKNNETSMPLPESEEGFYYCHLVLPQDTLTQPFYKGNYDNLVSDLSLQVTSLCEKELRETHESDLKAGLQRVKHLQDYDFTDTTSNSEIQYVNKNRVFWGRALQNNIRACRDRSKRQAGTYLKTYRTKEGSINHFLLHAGGKALKKEKVPLVMIVPYETYTSSMIESWYIGNLPQIEYDCKLADQYGVMLCWLFMNGENYTPESGNKDALNVLKRIKEDFPVSNEQTWLMGDCEGAQRALLLAAAHPRHFSGLTLISPVFSKFNPRQTKKLQNKSIYINHGTHDTSSPIEETRKFVKTGKRKGLNIELEEWNKNHLNIHRAYRKDAFQFIHQHENNNH